MRVPGTRYLVFNPRHKPLDDERVRRALAHGLNRTDYPDPAGMLGPLLEATPVLRSTETDRLLARARSLRFRDERLDLYRQADRQLVAEQCLRATNRSNSFIAHGSKAS